MFAVAFDLTVADTERHHQGRLAGTPIMKRGL